MLARLIENERAESFDLTNRITIEVGTCSYRTVRGYTFVAVLADELAFWRSEESASPDYEVLNAIRPGTLTIPNAMLLCASSPYARRGALYDAHSKYHGVEDPEVLVWQAPTINPTVPQSYIDKKLEDDHADASAEYLAQFRTDVEAFVTLEAIRACVEPGVFERAPEPRHAYFARGASSFDLTRLKKARRSRSKPASSILVAVLLTASRWRLGTPKAIRWWSTASENVDRREHRGAVRARFPHFDPRRAWCRHGRAKLLSAPK